MTSLQDRTATEGQSHAGPDPDLVSRLAHPDGTGPLRVVVAPVRSVLQPQLKGLGDLEPVELRTGATADLDQVVRRLADIAYARTDLVTKRGEFAVRGGILDVFPPTEEHPLRVEFWGDEIEEIRSFAVADQRTLSPVDRFDQLAERHRLGFHRVVVLDDENDLARLVGGDSGIRQ